MKIKIYAYSGLFLSALFGAACQPLNQSGAINPNNKNVNSNNVNSAQAAAIQPTIEIAPVQPGEGSYQIVTNDALKITVRAAGASAADVFYQPVTADDRALKLKTLTAQTNGEFVADLKTPADFNGEVWAQVRYSNNETKETEHLLLAAQDSSETTAQPAVNTEQAANDKQLDASTLDKTSNDAANKSLTDDDSARSDKKTNGQIEKVALQPNNPDIRITVNVPAFRMTLWQNGKEVATYNVGVGRKQYPIPIGLRSADKIILNPDWIPPDSEWVRKSGLTPYERIPASDSENPLGKIKIPLGNAYLLHEAQSPADLGNLVSHGCVRVLREDLFALTSSIVRARGAEITAPEIKAARTDSKRRVVNFDEKFDVDINYDTIVVEAGVLHIYPDVYERDTNTTEKLRAELVGYGVDPAKLDDATLTAMIGKVTGEVQFDVSLADIKAGNALAKGKTEPLTPQQAKTKGEKSKSKNAV